MQLLTVVMKFEALLPKLEELVKDYEEDCRTKEYEAKIYSKWQKRIGLIGKLAAFVATGISILWACFKFIYPFIYG